MFVHSSISLIGLVKLTHKGLKILYSEFPSIKIKSTGFCSGGQLMT